MGGLRVKVQHLQLTLLVVLTTLTLPCERDRCSPRGRFSFKLFTHTTHQTEKFGRPPTGQRADDALRVGSNSHLTAYCRVYG